MSRELFFFLGGVAVFGTAAAAGLVVERSRAAGVALLSMSFAVLLWLYRISVS